MGVPLTETEAKFNPEDPSLTASSANRVPVGPRPEGRAAFTVPETNETSAVPDPNAAPEPVDYDQFVKSLAFDRRAKPTDRTKTEEEIALEEKEKLEEAEKKRLRRMRGEPDSDEEDEGAGGKGKKRKAKVDENRKRGADDLEDDFDMEEGEMGMEGAYGLGGGLGDAGPEGEDEDEEMEDGDEEDGSEGEDDEEGTGEEESDDMEDLDDSEAGEAQPEDGDDEEDVSTLPTDTSLLIPSATKSIAKAAVRTAKSTASKAAARKELPFTFPCPTSHEEFVELLEEHDVGPERPEDVEIVVKRIRAVWHPSLGEGNKERMQILMTILTDYIFSVLSPPAPSFTTLSLLLPHLIALQTSYPLLAAQHTISKLVLMQKNLSRGLSRGSSLPDSKTFPGLPELGMLRVIGCVWSTSDYSHPVVAPAMLLMGQYLSQARVRDLKDIGSGLFLSGLVLQYESLSKRYIPEVISFLAQTILLLTPHSFTASTLPGSFPFTDLDTDRVALLKITKSKSISPSSFADLPALLALDGELDLDEAEEAQAKVDLLATAWRLVGKFATLYSSLDGFVEVFRPIEELLKGLNVKKLSPAMQVRRLSPCLSPASTFGRSEAHCPSRFFLPNPDPPRLNPLSHL
jgi:nucleolar protein 14